MDNAAQEQTSSAIADGRRIYLGNLLYSVKPEDVDALLQEHGLGKYEKIHLSFDPVSARNPGYCFVEFFHRDDADQALNTLAGAELVGRPVKVGPCHAKTPSQRQGGGYPRSRDDSQPVQRWGDWRAERQPASPNSQERRQGQPDNALHNAITHHDEMITDGQGRRLFVGGLGKMINQEQHQDEVRGYFAGFDVKAIGKRITPREETRAQPGNHHYCFVDFGSAEEAQRAQQQLNGTPIPPGTLKVSMAKPPRSKASDSYEPNRYSSPRKAEGNEGGDRPPRAPQRSMMSNNWRSKES